MMRKRLCLGLVAAMLTARKKIAQQVDWQDDPEDLLGICRRCPYYEGNNTDRT
jgi:hypothetical protein